MSKKQTTDEPQPADLSMQVHVEHAGRMVEKVDMLQVGDANGSLYAQGMRSTINAKIKILTEERMSITRDMDAAKKKIMDLFRTPIDTLQLCVRALDRKILAFDSLQQAAAREEQRKLDEQTEKQRQRDLELSRKAEERGDLDKAESFADRAATRVAPIVQSESVAAPGVSFRSTWSFEITDPKKVLMVTPDEVRIGKAVRAMGMDAQALVGEGVRIFEKRGIAS